MIEFDTGDRWPLYKHLQSGPMFHQWHWLHWNFNSLFERSNETYFARTTLDALLRCDVVVPGFANQMLDRVSAMGGKEKDPDDYQQILQWLAELVVVHHFVTWKWLGRATFEHEPTTTTRGNNPEVIVNCGSDRLGIEVKCPNLVAHQLARSTNDIQALSRMEHRLDVIGASGVTLPRDNPMKDFLHSCESKFTQFRDNQNFYSLLVVVWDDFINEPIAALLSPSSGLFTPNSFDKDALGNRSTYQSTDAVVILRHQGQLKRATNNELPVDEREDFMDWGHLGAFPHNALVMNPDGRILPPQFGKALQSVAPSRELGAEYVPGDSIMWL